MTDKSKSAEDCSDDFERALLDNAEQRYVLRLYIAGISPKSQQAVTNIKEACERHLPGRYELEVIDIYSKPSLAIDEKIVAVPTLLKVFPPPLRKLIGDLSCQEKLLFGLDLKPLK